MYVQMIEIHSSYHHFDPAHLRMSMSMIPPVIRGMLVSTRHLSSPFCNQIAIPTNNLRQTGPGESVGRGTKRPLKVLVLCLDRLSLLHLVMGSCSISRCRIPGQKVI
jgi:hypothetical protein